MMPPTSIDGTDITGATIDGTDVTEITVDGDTVFTAGLPDEDDLHARYDFSQATGTSTVNDLSGNGHTLTGSYTGPTGSINSKTAGVFDGVDDFLDNTFSSVSQPITMFLVARLNDFATGGEKKMIDGASNAEMFIGSSIGSDWRVFAGSVMDNGAADADDHIFSILFDGSNSELRIDGTSEATGNVGSNSLNGLTIGAYGNVSNFTDMVAGEWLIYPQDKSAIFSNVESFLSGRWGISV